MAEKNRLGMGVLSDKKRSAERPPMRKKASGSYFERGDIPGLLSHCDGEADVLLACANYFNSTQQSFLGKRLAHRLSRLIASVR